MNALRHPGAAWLWMGLGALCIAASSAQARALAAVESEIAQVISAVAPQVVTVQASFSEPMAAPPFPPVVNIGSGLLVDSLGYVVTSSGVVTRFPTVAPSLVVIDHRKRSHEAILYSIDDNLRIAVLYVPTLAGTAPPQMREDPWFGGAIALVVGNSFGIGASVSLMTVAGRRERDGFWQLSNPATPGYSGAPVFDANGALGGVLVGEVAGSGADPNPRPLPAVMVTLERLKPLLDRLASLSSAGGKPWLGIAVRPRTERNGRMLIYVSSVFSGSPAWAAGLEPGDVLVRVDTLSLSYVGDLAEWIRHCAPGHEASLQILRAGERRTVMVRVGQRRQ
jgi:S1-C subfamily serine protease